MNIYLDFEATQFKENIIAIGASCERGRFDCLVHPPKGDKITNFIAKLTGITNEMVEYAPYAEEAFRELFLWLREVGQITGSPMFYHVFGNMDKVFLQRTIQHIEEPYLKHFVENLSESLIDDSKKVCRYFHTKAVGVYKALKYFDNNLPEQDHDPLNDAIALERLMNMINYAPTLEECPFEKNKPNPPAAEFKNFVIIVKKENNIIKTFKNSQAAYDWAYNKVIKTNPEASKNTVFHNVAKAYNNNKSYLGFKWHKEFIKEV